MKFKKLFLSFTIIVTFVTCIVSSKIHAMDPSEEPSGQEASGAITPYPHLEPALSEARTSLRPFLQHILFDDTPGELNCSDMGDVILLFLKTLRRAPVELLYPLMSMIHHQLQHFGLWVKEIEYHENPGTQTITFSLRKIFKKVNGSRAILEHDDPEFNERYFDTWLITQQIKSYCDDFEDGHVVVDVAAPQIIHGEQQREPRHYAANIVFRGVGPMPPLPILNAIARRIIQDRMRNLPEEPHEPTPADFIEGIWYDHIDITIRVPNIRPRIGDSPINFHHVF
jgi:hypothetical protein